jgi:dihydropteroate synthase
MKKITVKNLTLDWGARTYVMGILNITPDSFSGDGMAELGLVKAMAQARRYVDAGVDIIDVGGESTRPGAAAVSAAEEMDRVLPLLSRLVAEYDVPISIDTYKASVAKEALNVGAEIINDVWGFRADPDLSGLAAQKGVPVILMHNRSTPNNTEIKERLGGRYVGVEYQDLIEDVKNELLESVSLAHQAGVPDELIILDPGIGFGKTVEQNIMLINRLNEIRELGYPLLLGPSRKSFIGFTLDLPVDDRVEGTAAAVAVGITRGADIIRVHDVTEIVRVARMTDAIVR